MSRASNATAWALACQLFSRESPVLESALSDAERVALAMLGDWRAVKPHIVDMRFALCPYCQLLRGAVVQSGQGLACQCPDCGSVPLDSADRHTWVFDADWLIRKLRGAFDVPAQQAAVPITAGIWRVGSHERRPLILARRLDLASQQPAALMRAGTRSANPPWVITPKPLNDVEGDPFGSGMIWLPLEERFALYGGNLQFIEPGKSAAPFDDDTAQAVNGPFSADFRHVHLSDWTHGPILLTEAQTDVFKALWHFKGQEQQAETIMTKAERDSGKPIDVFKVKPKNKGDPKYEGPLHAYKSLVITNQRAGTYAMPCAAP